MRPIVGQQQIRQYVNALVAVSPFTGELATLLARDLDVMVMSAFLYQIEKRFPGEFCVLVLDGAG